MLRALLVGAVALALGIAWHTGAYSQLTPESIAAVVERAGLFGPVIFVGLFAAAELVHLPGLLFVFAAAALWPLAIAIPTAYCGALAAALLVFAISRQVVPAGLRERLPAWLLRYESHLESHGFRSVLLLRLVLFMAPIVHWLLGASRVTFRNYLLGSALGLLPGVIVFTLLGREAIAHWQGVQPWAIGGAAVLVGLLLGRRLYARLTPARPSP
jgi:uncharacterized membrane protein YdjX (TVP38/TMEM64 family)